VETAFEVATGEILGAGRAGVAREFHAIGTEADAGDFMPTFDDDGGDRGELEATEYEAHGWAGVDEKEAIAGREALEGEDAALEEVAAAAGIDIDNFDDAEATDKLVRYITKAGMGGASTGAGGAAAGDRGGEGSENEEDDAGLGDALTGGGDGSTEVGRKRPRPAASASGEAPPPAAKRRAQRSDEGYTVDKVTEVRERLSGLLAAHGGQVTLSVVSREFKHELATQGEAFKTTLLSVLRAMTYQRMAPDKVTKILVRK